MSRSEQQGATPAPALDYWNLFRELPAAYLLIEANDPVYTIVELNKAREKLTGVVRKQVIGRPLFEVHPDSSEEFARTGNNSVQPHLKRVITTGKPQILQPLRYDMKGRNGRLETRYWQSTYIPLMLDSKRVTHILAVTQDVTNEYGAEKRMATAEERLEAALSIGRVGSWTWDLEEDHLIADANLAAMFGIPKNVAAKGLPVSAFMANIHPDDRARVSREIERAIKGKTNFEQEYRTVGAGGKQHWVLVRGKVQLRDGKKVFPGVVVDITERRNLQAQVELARQQDVLNRQSAKLLQDRNEELEALTRTKDEFVALASHQLRTPATAVKQYLGMVLQGYVGDISDLQTDMLDKAFESNERQIQIINQILNAARADTGRLVMTPVPLDLRTLARGIADEMRPGLDQRHHTFTVRLPKVPVQVAADLGYMRMAIENLLHNASIYTPEGGRVDLSLKKVGKQARLSITDNGVGIRKADQAKLFTKFTRIHNSLSVQAGGSGIGLYLAAEIVRLHGGSVTVESRRGKGTTFAILLPVEQNKHKP